MLYTTLCDPCLLYNYIKLCLCFISMRRVLIQQGFHILAILPRSPLLLDKLILYKIFVSVAHLLLKYFIQFNFNLGCIRNLYSSNFVHFTSQPHHPLLICLCHSYRFLLSQSTMIGSCRSVVKRLESKGWGIAIHVINQPAAGCNCSCALIYPNSDRTIAQK